MLQTPIKKFPGQGEFDPINSTFFHKIHATTGRILKGYSKSKLYPEMQDKIVLLQKIILRLTNKGYLQLDRSGKIEFYKKAFLSDKDEKILTLYPSQFEFAGDPEFMMNENLNTFLHKLYTQLTQGKIVTSSLSVKPKKLQVDPFDLSYKRFKKKDEVLDYVLKKHKEGYEHGMCFAFYNAYVEKFSL